MDHFPVFNRNVDNLEAYIARMELAFDMYKVDTDAHKITHLTIKLGDFGSAFTLKRPPGQTYAQLRDRLLRTLCPPSNPTQLQMKLKSLKCVDNKFHDLSLDIQRISQEIYADCPAAIRDLNEVQAFVNAVSPQIRSHLLLFNFTNIFDAVQAADRKLDQLEADAVSISRAVVGTFAQGKQEQHQIESPQEQNDSQNKTSEKQKKPIEVESKETVAITEEWIAKTVTAAANEIAGNKLRDQVAQQDKTQLEAYINSIDQKIHDLALMQNPNPRPNTRFQAGGRRGPVICFFCGQPGHIQRNCSLKKHISSQQQPGQVHQAPQMPAGASPMFQSSTPWTPSAYPPQFLPQMPQTPFFAPNSPQLAPFAQWIFSQHSPQTESASPTGLKALPAPLN